MFAFQVLAGAWCASSTNRWLHADARAPRTSSSMLPTTAMVATATLQLRMNRAASSGVSNLCSTLPTTGREAVPSITPNRWSTPNVENFPAIWSRRADVGTTTRSDVGRSRARRASMVSVLPVPVGMTTVPVPAVTFQCASEA